MRLVTTLASLGLAIVTLACESDPRVGGRPIGEWITRLSDRSPTVRIEAAGALRNVLAINPRSVRSAQALVRALADSVDGVRLAAGIALATEGVNTPGVSAGLATMLRDSAHSIVRVRAADLLGLVKVDVPVAEEALASALSDSVGEVRIAAIESLGELGSSSEPTIRKLVALYDDSLPQARGLVVRTLGRLKAATEESRIMFARALSDSDPRIRSSAATAIGTLGTGATLLFAALLSALADPEPNVRHAVIVAIGQLGESTPMTLRQLDQVGQDDSVDFVRSAAVYTAAVVRGERPPLKGPPEPSALERCAGANRSKPGC